MKNQEEFRKGIDHPLNGSKIGFKLYIEGIPVPFLSGSVSSGINTPAVASVTLPFSPLISHLRPRSIVTLTYFINNERNEYILFDGDFMGYGVSGNASSKVATLNLVSPISMMGRYRRYSTFGLDSFFKAGTTVFATTDTIIDLDIGTAIQNLFGTTTLGALIKAFVEADDETYPEGIIKIFRQYMEESNFRFSDVVYNTPEAPYQSHYKLYQYFEQIAYSKNLTETTRLVKNYLNTAILEELLNAKLGSGTSQVNDLWTTLLAWLNQFFMNYVDLGVPHKYIDVERGDLRQMYRSAVAPHNQFLLPPLDNVILPDAILQLNTNVNYTNEITRYALALSNNLVPGFDTVDSRVRYAPSYQFAGIDKSVISDAVGGYIESVRSFDRSFSNNESYLGVSALVMSLPEYFARTTTEENDEEGEELYTKLADSIFLDQKFGSRGANAACVFLPRVVPGFSCFIADTDFPFFGFVQSVNHSFNAAGGCSTMIGISHMTQFMDYLTPALRTAHMYDQNHGAYSVGEVYKEMGFRGSMMDLVADAIPGVRTVVESLGISQPNNDVNAYLFSFKKRTVDSLKNKGFHEEANQVNHVSMDNIALSMLTQDSATTKKKDEGFVKLLLADILLEAIRTKTITDDAVSTRCRDLVDTNAYANFSHLYINGDRYSRFYWMSDVFKTPPYKYPLDADFLSDPMREQYLQRMKAAKALADSLEQTNQATKTKPNNAHSLFGIFSDDIITKSPEETKWRDSDR